MPKIDDNTAAAVLKLRRDGRTIKSIASEMGISPEAVRNRELKGLRLERECGKVWFTLSLRARNCMLNWLGEGAWSDCRITPDKLRSSFASKPEMLHEAEQQPNIGAKTLAEIAKYWDM